MPKLFVDTSGFYAVADLSDRHHAAASALFVARGQDGDLVTTDHVFVESWCLIQARLGRPAAIAFWDSMRSGVVEVLGVQGTDLERGRAIVGEWWDQAFSLVDATSFAIMERHGLVEALALDRHFRTFRAGSRRDRAFRVLPVS